MKILIVEDDHDTRHILTEILNSAGYEVAAAEDGEEGLRLVRADRPSLVITDILMPGIDGFRFLSEVRKDAGLRDLPVVFYTGNYLDKDDEKLARDLGVSRFLLKPLPPADLLAVVKELLEKKPRSIFSQAPHSSLDEPAFLKLYNERLVTKLKQKVLENEKTRRSLEHVMDGMGDGIMVIDRDYLVTQVNSAVAVSLGVGKEEIVGRKCYEVTHKRQAPCEAPNIICPLSLIFERGEGIVKVLHTHIDAQGNERQIEITASPVRDRRGRVLAVVETHRDIMEKCSDDELIKLVKKLSEAQVHLKQISITDELTGLRNRRYIFERLDEEFERALRSGHLLSVIMLDIDHFKKVNDNYGHLFGDIVLQAVAARIKLSLRRHDLVGRVGGEEFLVICPESSLEDTLVVAERIRKVVNDEDIGNEVNDVRIALSAGVTDLKNSDSSFEKLFSRADSALYMAKEQGRNRVVVL